MSTATPWWKRSASGEDYIDLAEQEELYRAESGDKPWFVVFDARFAAWCEKHQRSTLTGA
jgi:hypothetical protein